MRPARLLAVRFSIPSLPLAILHPYCIHTRMEGECAHTHCSSSARFCFSAPAARCRPFGCNWHSKAVKRPPEITNSVTREALMTPEHLSVRSLSPSVRPARLRRLLPLLLLLLSACQAGDIGSSTTSSSATVDNSDDHSVHGDTNCTVTVSVQPVDGVCTFSHECSGSTVDAGEFAAQPDGQCVLPTPSPEPTAAEDSTASTTDTSGTLNQTGAL